VVRVKLFITVAIGVHSTPCFPSVSESILQEIKIEFDIKCVIW
jgi:hypothetical protein